MSMPRKRPLENPKQFYAYVWRLKDKVIWVGCGRGNRGRPTCRACWSGRPKELKDLLREHCNEIDVTILPCDSQSEARLFEELLIKELEPAYNIAPHYGGWKSMHSPEGLARISKANTGRAVSDKVRESRRSRMIGNQNLLGHTHTEETKSKISAANKGRPISDLCREKASQRASERNVLNPPRKGKKCSAEHKRKLSEARRRWWAAKQEQDNAH